MRKVVCKNFQELMEQVHSSEPGTAYIVSAPSSNGEITITFLTLEDMLELPVTSAELGTAATLH